MKQLSIIVVATTVLLGACSPSPEPETKEQQPQQQTQQLAPSEVVLPQVREMSTSLRVHGRLDVPPEYLHSLAAPLGGIVCQVRLLPGQQVRKGQVLLILEDPEFIHLQEEYLTAKNRLDLAMLDLKRQESLAQDTVNARKALERAQSEAALLRVSVHSTQEQLALIGINAASLTAENISRNVSVKAPFDGFITQVSVNTGSAVPPRGQLVEMADPSRLHVALQVFERDAAFVRQGQTTQVEVSGQSVPRNARIHLVGTEVGLDRSVVVHAHFDKPDASLRPGTTVTATINIEPRQALLVPESAIVTQAGKSSVYVRMPDGSLRNTDVTTGARTDGLIEVASPDLHPESEVLVKGAMVR